MNKKDAENAFQGILKQTLITYRYFITLPMPIPLITAIFHVSAD